MPHPLRAFLASALLAWHTLLTLGGSGLHALPGMGHGSELNRPSRNDHSHGPGRSSHDLTEECPVCHYLSGSQAVADGDGGIASWLVLASTDPSAPLLDPSPIRSSTVARGPPPLA